MNYNKYFQVILLAGCLMITGCAASEISRVNELEVTGKTSPTKINDIESDEAVTEVNGQKGGGENCPDAEISYIDALMLNDINYHSDYPGYDAEKNDITVEEENEIGIVDYTLYGSACAHYKMTNGDATFLPEGTPIYSVKGYPSSFIVAAAGKIYVADMNNNANTAGELQPLKGLVKEIYFESAEDGRKLNSFSPQSLEEFVEVWETLKKEEHEVLYRNNSFEGERVFMRLMLHNGASFRLVYWSDTNTFSNGIIGNERIQEILLNELQ
ncbi:hypothetical protein [Sutcliffiella rhizosphaerae]|uniref:Lipoprotein n=1 Tax=Sutcliffiella rhizosphaerae TaxID=2880967 RepID=A0ABN8ACT2_9BACI|nr:hypothetical protein [Sutcliffiella rhizosphaerae]CAG9623053.1 hypothetical protein BACCIP111883_03848 [Sutcliffiella rhizosphaerae]